MPLLDVDVKWNLLAAMTTLALLYEIELMTVSLRCSLKTNEGTLYRNAKRYTDEAEKDENVKEAVALKRWVSLLTISDSS